MVTATGGDYFQCSTPNCNVVAFIDNPGESQLTCPECKESFCAKCKKPSHTGKRCAIVPGERTHIVEMPDNVRQCPTCPMMLEKTGGCNDIVCTACKEHFCWCCGEMTIPGDGHFEWEDSCSYYASDNKHPLTQKVSKAQRCQGEHCNSPEYTSYPCGHGFCDPCYHQILKTASKRKNAIVCPLCREDASHGNSQAANQGFRSEATGYDRSRQGDAGKRRYNPEER